MNETNSDGPAGFGPGASPRPPALAAMIASALRDKGPRYVPRTRHRRPDGSPRYTNRLILETSPYLLQHAHNPVDWHAWGDEPFDRAREEGRAVLLSVGYSTCHWCHVMEAESFEDEEIARELNERYVCIKVDREERPDVDAIYMAAVQAISGGGGWPMTVFLTPDRQPFFGGTYFPPRDGARGARRGFLSILREIDRAYRSDRAAIGRQAEALTAHVRQAVSHPAGGGELSAEPLHRAARDLLAQFDPAWGGFGHAPKFPRTVALEFLLRYARRTGRADALGAVETTLDRMARGGMYDQIGGGFHRYSTDARWLVPHFEKMLYDNALLAVAYLEGAQATGREDFSRIARETLDYLLAEMRSPEGGFYSATDADSEGEEGRFFVWTEAQIDAALPAERARVVKAYWDVGPGGNFEGASILWVPRPAAEVARSLGVDAPRLLAEVAEARRTLYAVRASREPPLRDDKILAGWNGLAISALARAGFQLNEPRYIEAAERAAEFVQTRMVRDGRLMRSFGGVGDAPSRHPAFLEDYSFLIAAWLDLFEATQRPRWLTEAVAFERVVAERFADPEGGFFATASDAEALLAREKPDYDGATPSANSVQIQNLLRLSELTGEERYRAEAERGLRAFSVLLGRAPSAAPRLLSALDFLLDRPKQIVIVAPAGTADPIAAAEPLFARLRRTFVPNSLVVVSAEGAPIEALRALVPLVGEKTAESGRVTAYVCEGRTCELPTGDPETFARQIARVLALPSS